MEQKALLAEYLYQLKLPTFFQNDQLYAQDAARGEWSYERYLLVLCEAEMAQREVNRIERSIAAAKFPVVKELSTFDFSVVGGIAKTRVLELAQGGYLVLMGNPG